jgi:hypothetical protein
MHFQCLLIYLWLYGPMLDLGRFSSSFIFYTYKHDWYWKEPQTHQVCIVIHQLAAWVQCLTKWRRSWKRVSVCWNMRDFRLLMQCTEMNHHVNRAFCCGIGSLRILVVCVNGKARDDQYSVLKWNESFVETLYFNISELLETCWSV